MRAALARIGEMLYTPKHEALRVWYNGITPLINGFKRALEPAAESLGRFMIESAKASVIKFVDPFIYFDAEGNAHLISSLENTIRNFATSLGVLYNAGVNLLRPFGEAFAAVFLGDGFTDGLEDASKGFLRLSEAIEKFTSDIAGPQTKILTFFFTLLKFVGTVVIELIKVFFDLGESLEFPAGGILDFIGHLMDLGTEFLNSLMEGEKFKSFFEGLKTVLSGPVALIQIVIDGFKALFEVLRESGISEMIFDGIKTALGWLNDRFLALTETIKPYVERMREVRIDGEKVRDVFNQIGNAIKDVYDKVKGPATDAFNAIKKFFQDFIAQINAGENPLGSFQDKIVELWENIKNAFSADTKLGQALRNIRDYFVNLWEDVKPAFDGFLDSLTNFFSKLKEAFDKMETQDWVNAISFAAVITFFVNAFKFMKSLRGALDQFSAIGTKFGETLDSIKDTLTRFKKETKSTTFVKIAAGIALLAGSIWLVAQIPQDQLWTSLGAIAALAGIVLVLMGALALFEKFGGEKSTAGVTLAILGVSVSIMMLANVVKQLGEMDEEAMYRAVGGVTALALTMGILAVVLGGLEKIKGTRIIGAALGLMVFSLAIRVMAGVLETFAAMDAEKFEEGGIRLVIMMGALAVSALALGAMGGKVITGAIGLAIFAGVLRLFIDIILEIAAMEPEQVLQGFIGLGIAFMLLAGTALILGHAGTQAMAGGMGILVMAAAMVVMALAVRMLADLDIATVALNLLLLIGAVAALAVVSKLMNTALPGATSMVIVAGSLLILALALRVLAGVPFMDLAAALVVLGIAMVGMVAAGHALTGAAPGLITFGLALALAGVAALAFVAALVMFGPAIVSVGLSLMILGSQMQYITPHMGSFIELGLVMIALGVGLAVLGAAAIVLGLGLAAMGVGLMLLATSGVAGTAALMHMIEEVKKLNLLDMAHLTGLSVVFAALGASLLILGAGALLAGVGALAFAVGWAAMSIAVLLTAERVADALAKMAAKVGPTMEVLTSALLRAASLILPATQHIVVAFDRMGERITSAIDSVNESIANAGTNMVMALVNSITAALPTVNRAAQMIVLAFVLGLMSGLNQLQQVGPAATAVLAVSLLMSVNLLNPVAKLYVMTFTTALASNAAMVASAGTAISAALIMSILTKSPMMLPVGKAYIAALVSAIISVQGNVDKAGNATFVSYTKGLSRNVKDLITIATGAIAILILAIASTDRNVVSAGDRTARAYTTSVANTLRGQQASVLTPAVGVGTAINAGLIRGINAGSARVSRAARQVALNALAAAKNALGVASPSKEMEKVGLWFDEGLSRGIDRGSGVVVKAAKSLSETAMDAVRDSLSFDDGREFDNTLVITPVLDLSEVSRGADALDSILGDSSVGSFDRAATLSSILNGRSDSSSENSTGGNLSFVQNNYSPKALSAGEIYRQTRNHLSVVKESLN